MCVVCCVSCVGRYALCVVCCVFCVMCWVVCVVCCALCVVRCVLCVVCRVSCVVCRVLCVARCVLCVVCCVLCVVCRVLCVVCCVFVVVCRLLCVVCCVLCVCVVCWLRTTKVSMICIEEYLAFVRGKVGLMLLRSMVKARKKAGEVTRYVEESDGWLGVDVMLNEKKCTLIAACAPTWSSSAATAQKAKIFEDGDKLQNQWLETTICGGDFNSHIGKKEELEVDEEYYEEKSSEVMNEVIGRHRLSTPTAKKSKQLVEWLADRGLKHVDSHCTCGQRGTWWHMKVYPVGTVQLMKVSGRAWETVRTASRHR